MSKQPTKGELGSFIAQLEDVGTEKVSPQCTMGGMRESRHSPYRIAKILLAKTCISVVRLAGVLL